MQMYQEQYRTTRCKIPVDLKYIHIRYHQDDKVLYGDLNDSILFDILATIGLKRYNTHRKQVYDTFPHEKMIITAKGAESTVDNI